jgi:hypothetical protein
MNVPTHYNTMSDSDILRDLFARSYGGDPVIAYGCDRWEAMVDAEKDRQEELEKLTSEKEGAELRADDMQKEIDELNRQIFGLERTIDRLESRGDEELE